MYKISVIGGDLRQTTVAELLKKDGYDVVVYGFNSEADTYDIKQAENLNTALNRDILILPLPVTIDNDTIHAPFSKEKIYISEILENMNKDAIILGGKINGCLKEKFLDYSIKWYDYLSREEMAVQNAVPTAEGALSIAINETPITIAGSRCMVIGYGRIGQVLCNMLKNLGSEVIATARKCSDLAWIENMGYKAIHTDNIAEHIGKCDIIFNTVPYVILNKAILSLVPKNSLIIDLSSKPGGVDFNFAQELNLRAIWALSIPGKTAPVTAGKIIKNTVVNIINEMEV